MRLDLFTRPLVILMLSINAARLQRRTRWSKLSRRQAEISMLFSFPQLSLLTFGLLSEFVDFFL